VVFVVFYVGTNGYESLRKKCNRRKGKKNEPNECTRRTRNNGTEIVQRKCDDSLQIIHNHSLDLVVLFAR
jgi:hypothetical protein